MPRGRRLVSLAILASLAVAACGREAADRTAGSGAAGTGFPATVAAANGDVVIEKRPEAIVSLSPTATELLFAIGAGEQVVAVDSNSNFPPEAPTTDLAAFEPNVEAIAEHDPDLVVISDDIEDLVAGLEAVGIPVIHQPVAANLDDTYRQIEQLGTATGATAAAGELVASMRSELERLAASTPESQDPPTYYHELDQNLFTVTSETFIGQIYAMAGLENIADAAQDAAGGYPQLSAEFIVDADPDLVFLADTKCCDQSAETVAARPGWDRIAAVRQGRVVELDDDVASRWGPRVVELMETIVAAVSEMEAAA